MSPLMKFFVSMFVVYTVLCAVWVFHYVRYWDDVLLLQHCITSVIALGLLEVTFWYIDFAYFNSTGIRPFGVTAWVVTIGSLRRAVSRVLILCVSMGYGFVRPTLGGLSTKMLLIGITYLLATEMLSITENVGSINDITGRARVFFVIPVVFLDTFLILWIFTSLSRTLEQLQAKRSSIKLDMYRKLSNALAVAVITSVVWIGYEIYFKATDPFNERWQSAWIITAFWDVLAFSLLCVICYIWAPSQSSQRYAYMDNKGEELEKEETDSFFRETPDGGSISLVKQVERQDTYTSEF